MITDAEIDLLEVGSGSHKEPAVSFSFVSLDFTRSLLTSLVGRFGPRESQAYAEHITRVRKAFSLAFAKAIRKEFPNIPLRATLRFRSGSDRRHLTQQGVGHCRGGKASIFKPFRRFKYIAGYEQKG